MAKRPLHVAAVTCEQSHSKIACYCRSTGLLSQLALASEMGPRELEIADFNGDGNLDIAATNGRVRHVSVLLGAGDGDFLPQVRYDTGSTEPSAPIRNVVSGDFDGDTDLDLVVSGWNTGPDLVMLENDGNGAFVAGSFFADDGGARSGPSGLVTADFDSDGNLDLASLLLSTGEIAVMLGAGDGTFGAMNGYGTRADTGPQAGGRVLISADFNGDDVVDLAALSNINSLVSVLIGVGDGTFESFTGLNESDGSPVESIRFIEAADFDSDGSDELVVITLGESEGVRSFSYQDATNGFTEDSVTTTAHPDIDPNVDPELLIDPEYVVAGDLLGDAGLDVVAANATAPGASSSALSVLHFLSVGAGGELQFERLPKVSTEFTVGFDGSGLALADTDTDGDRDIVVINSDIARVSVFENLSQALGLDARAGRRSCVADVHSRTASPGSSSLERQAVGLPASGVWEPASHEGSAEQTSAAFAERVLGTQFRARVRDRWRAPLLASGSRARDETLLDPGGGAQPGLDHAHRLRNGHSKRTPNRQRPLSFLYLAIMHRWITCRALIRQGDESTDWLQSVLVHRFAARTTA